MEKKMKKKIFITIISIFTIGCIIAGTWYHIGRDNLISELGSAYNQLKSQNFNLDFDDDFDYDFDNAFDDDDFAENSDDDFADDSNDSNDWNKNRFSYRKKSGKEKLNSFNSIKLNAKIMSVKICRGNDYSIKYRTSRDYLVPVYEVKDNTLNIRQKGFVRREFGNKNCYVEITIPKEKSLDSVMVNTNIGKIVIKNVDIEDCIVQTNVGAVKINNVVFDKLNCESNVGEIIINPIQDIENYDMNISTNVGAIVVGGKNSSRSYTQRGKTDKRITAHTNVGEIQIK